MINEKTVSFRRLTCTHLNQETWGSTVFLFQHGPARLAPVVGGKPEQQLGPSHERGGKVAARNRLNAGLPERVIFVE
jgi:hypothetical protein